MPTTINIFYVDDDTDDQMLFSEAFQEIKEASASSLTLYKARNGEEFFNLLSEENVIPHIMFLDINMPVKNGFECLTEIRASQHLRDKPVVMFSTSESKDIISKSYLLGANKYIVKPPDFLDLKIVIENCLQEFESAT
jgi:CheY-like chemotaxis protein